MRVVACSLVFASLLVTGTALAEDEPVESAPAETTPAQPAPAPPPEGPRSEGLRLALDVGFWRASGSDSEQMNAGSPSLLPIGADVSWRTSRKVLLGFHGHAGLASRDDCLGDTVCTGRAYGLGAHVEAAFTAGGSFVPWFRYGLGWEMVHQLGAYRSDDAYRYRHAFDLIDVRFGGDFVVARGSGGRTTRIGPFAGMIVGLGVDEVSNGRASRDPDFGSGHVWFSIGARGTTDW